MPLVRSYAYEKLPAWAALKMYRKYCFHQGEAVEIELPYRRVAFVVLCGACEVEESGTKTLVRQYEVYESKTGSFTMHGVFQPPFYFIRNVDVLVIGGEWDGAEINLFMVNQSDCPETEAHSVRAPLTATIETRILTIIITISMNSGLSAKAQASYRTTAASTK